MENTAYFKKSDVSWICSQQKRHTWPCAWSRIIMFRIFKNLLESFNVILLDNWRPKDSPRIPGSVWKGTSIKGLEIATRTQAGKSCLKGAIGTMSWSSVDFTGFVILSNYLGPLSTSVLCFLICKICKNKHFTKDFEN